MFTDLVEQIKKLAARVPPRRVSAAADLFKKIYTQINRRHYLGDLTKPGHVTALRKIIAVCRIEGWSLPDYLEVNLLWFAKNSRYTATPTNFCGEKGWHRYEAFLRSEGYVMDNGLGLVVDGARRA